MKPLLVNFKPLDSLSPHLYDTVQFIPLVKDTIEDALNIEVIDASSWAELRSIPRETSIVEFHSSLPIALDSSIENVVDKIKRSISHTKAKLVIVIKKIQLRSVVERYRELGINGITLHSLAWSMQDRINSVKANFEGPYWPEEIINGLSKKIENEKPLVLFFQNNWEENIPTETFFKLDSETNPFRIKFCSTWKDVSDVIHLQPELIVLHENSIHIGHKVAECVSAIESLIFYTCNGKKIPLGLMVDQTTPYQLIKESKRTSIIGIVPGFTDYGLRESVSAVNSLLAGVKYWPSHIIDSLPGAIQKKPATDEIKLTGRQDEIFNLVCRRGLSNKKIAQILNISESTVKVHMSAILKAYRVRNRTQLALSGSQFLDK
jgi:DNA-binding CsgD family transcriptional regulator